MIKMKKILSIFLLTVMILAALTGCSDDKTQSFQSMEDFDQAKIGVLTGSSHDKTAQEIFPNAERVYFNNMSDMILAVEQGKIDCYLEDAQFLAPLIWEGVNLKQIDESVGQMSNGFVFPKGESTHLREQINEFLGAAKSDGTIERLTQKWLGKTEPTEHPDYSALTGENGTIRLAISVDNKPMLYQNADGFTGFEMELLTAFGQRYGYKFDIEVVPFESIIAGISANKYDMGASSLNITDERKESVDFSDAYSTFETVIVVKGDGKQTSGKTLSDFDNAKIGVLTGTVYDDYAKNLFPDAERKYFNLLSDMILAVESGKIDGFLAENTYVSAALWEGAKIDTVDESIDRTEAGFIFQKDSAKSATVREQLNTFLTSAKANGLLEQLNTKWIGNTEPTEFFDHDSLSGENGTLKVAVSPDLKPLCYMRNGAVAGYEVEVLQHFAKEYGYNLEFHSMAFDAILPGVVSGKYDIGCGGMTITEERAESVDFSESYLTVDVVMVISNAAAGQSDSSFWGGIKESFEKTFIREERWKLIAEGVGVTMLISLCAAAAGSLLGFGLYMLSRSDIKVLQKLTKGFAKGYSRIIAGTPIVVILMILFYVIFGNVRDMSGIVVAVIGFTLTFGAFVYDHMTVSVGSVDRGQTEAAYALGYTKNKTFFRIIFPQAMTIFLPSYCGQAVELIKATAVVGYIAVNDLTKMGDIIRSNTYEAFFPLIATAVIYFLLTWILASLLKLLKLCFEPKRRSKETILKGVKTR
jgi:polar amino acid transport system substrate-binding protein